MFGNVQGWVISAVMLLATAGALIYGARPPSESAWHDAVPLAFKPVELPISPNIVTPAPSSDCDAGEAYQQAIRLYLQNPKKYAEAARVDVDTLPAVALILKSAACSRMHLFDRNSEQAISYEPKPWITAVMALGQATDDAGLRLRNDHPEEAQVYYAAAFNFGRKLFDERVSWGEASKGLSIMSMSAEAMTKLADMRQDGRRVDALQKFVEKTNEYHTTLQEQVASPLGNPVESYSAPYAGDVFQAAKDPAVERMWRVEAILHLGHYRWNVADGNKGDQNWCMKELDKLDNSTNPKDQDIAIKTAVQAALGLTLDQQRATGGGE